MPAFVIACTVCFGNADSPLLDAARVGVLAMAGVTTCVLGTFGWWFIRLTRLSRRVGRIDTLDDASR
jgi:hypothetical protein